ncbi:MAG TPA: hypothetical protein VF144_10685 [Chitinophagaceae bacterium]
MRKSILSLPIGAMILFLVSCQKGTEDKTNTNDQLISKVNSWLDKQKFPSQPNKAGNIDLLKSNLSFSGLRFEQLNQEERFIVIPVNEEYAAKKNIDRNVVLMLLLVVNKATNIIRGNLVLYTPENNESLKTFPHNTFSKMHNNQNIDCNGLFNFQSVTGRKMYQREYKDGKLRSFGYVKASNKPDGLDNQPEGRIEADCTYYYYILTWWVDGVPVSQEAIFLGSICSGACDDPNNQTLCPDDGGGFGGSGSEGIEQLCCIPDPNAQFSSEQINMTRDDCGLEGANPITGNPIKSCTHSWTFHRWRLLWYKWDFTAFINTGLEKEAGVWKFKTIAFQSVARDGQLPPCVSSECTVNAANVSISADGSTAQLILNYTIENRVNCYVWWAPQNMRNMIQKDWPVPL